MKSKGYYEIKKNNRLVPDLNVEAFAGNVRFNRLHWHEHLEIICCVAGSFQLRIDGTLLTLRAGDLVTINSGLDHEISNGTPDGLQLIISIDPQYLHHLTTEIYDCSTIGEHARSLTDPDIQSLRHSLGKMTWLLTPDVQTLSLYEQTIRPTHPPLVLQCEEEWNTFHMELYNVLRILSRHKKPKKEESTRSVSRELFAKCIQIVHEEYKQPLNAKILAKRVHVSEPTIYRMFHQWLGISLVNYLNTLRVNIACGYLENTRLSVTEIAEQCGFTSLSNFYHVFHLFNGIAPNQYRKKTAGNLPGKDLLHQDIMDFNQFQHFWELPYKKDDLLI